MNQVANILISLLICLGQLFAKMSVIILQIVLLQKFLFVYHIFKI